MKASLISTLVIASAVPAAAFGPNLPSSMTARRALSTSVVSVRRVNTTPLRMSAPPIEEIKLEQTTSPASTSYSFEGGFNVTTVSESKQEELSETQKLMAKVKDAGTAGIISYALWELGFWFISIPVVLFGYYEVTGHWPDLTNSDDMGKLAAEAFAFVNFARFAVPLRIGLALSTTPWIEENIVEKFFKKHENEDKNEELSS